MPDSLAAAREIALLADSKKAADISILDLRGISDVADFFVITSVSSTTQAEALAEAIRLALRRGGRNLLGIEGTKESGWILIDSGDVVVHIFDPALRAFYSIEELWGDAPRIHWKRNDGPSR